MPRPIRLFVIHCSASPNGRSLFSGVPGTPGFRDPAMEIDDWHRQKDFRRETYWRARMNPRLPHIGYHYVIARNGAVFTGRHEEEIPAQAEGWNAPALGLCLVGTDAFTTLQWRQLKATVEGVCKRLEIPLAPAQLTVREGRHLVLRPGVCGHRDIPGVVKSCPGFDVSRWLDGGLAPLPGHVDEAGA